MLSSDMGDKTLVSVCEPLMKEATRSLYKNNLFFLLGISPESSDLEIRKRIQQESMLLKAEHLSGSSRIGEDRLTEESLHEAELRLRKPELRLLDEFFYFWTKQEKKIHFLHHLIEELHGDDPLHVMKQWIKLEKIISTHYVHIHDFAILSHSIAMRLEEISIAADSKQILRNFFWNKSISLWNRCIQNEKIWNCLRERVRASEDPRLTTGFIRRIRESLLPALYAIHIHFFIHYYMKKDDIDREWHQEFLRSSRVDSAVLEQAFRSSGTLLIDRISHFCQSLANENSLSDHWSLSLEQHYRQVHESLEMMQSVLPHELSIYERMSDEVAKAIFQYVVFHGMDKKEYTVVLEWLQKAEAIAVSPSLRKRIQENQQIAQMHVDREPCWFCDEFFSDEQSVLSHKCRPTFFAGIRSKHLFSSDRIQIPRCPRCKSVHLRQRFYSLWSMGVGSIFGMSLIFIFPWMAKPPDIWIYLIILCFSGSVIGNWFYRKIAKRLIPVGIRSESDLSEHPDVMDLMNSWHSTPAPIEQIQP